MLVIGGISNLCNLAYRNDVWLLLKSMVDDQLVNRFYEKKDG